MRTDLHMHTYYSDGANSPAEIARMAAENGVELISMTDHDSMEGLEEKRAAAKEYGLYYVSGWEVSSYCALGKVHVLGYNCKPQGEYLAFLEKRMEGGVTRALDMIGKANARFGTDVTLEDAEAFHTVKSAPLHTMHVVRAYAQRLGAEFGELYEKYFAKGKPAYSDLCRPTPEEAIDVIHACGGIAVLAHPGRIPKGGDRREQLMDSLVAYGLDGIECSHSSHTVEGAEYFKAYTRGKNLLETAGSDFHCKEGSYRKIGLPEFHADDKLLRALGISR